MPFTKINIYKIRKSSIIQPVRGLFSMPLELSHYLW